MKPLLLLAVPLLLGAGPANLDELVTWALARDPAARADALDADAARERAAGATQPMAPQLMFSGQAIGAKEMDPDPPMYMAGLTQMLPGFGQLSARARRVAIDAERASTDRDRIAADLRTRFWQSAARLSANDDESALLDEQIAEATAFEEVLLARYRSGSRGTAAPLAPRGEAMESAMEPGATPPTVPRPGSAGGGGAMGGMGGGGRGSGATATPMPAGMADTGGGMPAMSGGAGGGAGLPAVLRLDAQIERLRAERSALVARREGEIAMLSLFVGREAADAISVHPAQFLGAAPSSIPETRLAQLERDAADADLAIARSRRRPDLMISGAVRAMPPAGTFSGVDMTLGIQIPLGGGIGREIVAARREVVAADARKEAVERDLAAAAASARGALAAARARATALRNVAVPRATAAYTSSRNAFAAGSGSFVDVLFAWSDLLSVRRELVDADRETRIRASDLARVEVQ